MNRSLLIVDDNMPLASATARQLEDAFDVVTVSGSYDHALDALKLVAYDAVLSDSDLGSKGSGAQLLKDIAARWPRTRRVLYTTTPKAVARAAHAVVEKPATNEELRIALLVDSNFHRPHPPTLDEQVAAAARELTEWLHDELGLERSHVRKRGRLDRLREIDAVRVELMLLSDVLHGKAQLKRRSGARAADEDLSLLMAETFQRAFRALND